MVRLSKIGIFAAYCISVYESYRGHGPLWFLTLIPIAGQLIWAGVLFQGGYFFDIFFIVVVISIALSLIAEVVAKRYRIK